MHTYIEKEDTELTRRTSLQRVSYAESVGRDSAVGTATRYRLDGLGIESGGGEIFRIRQDQSWGPPSLLFNGYRVFPGCKVAGAWRLPPTLISGEVKERAELYIFFLCRPSWPVLR